MWDLWTDGRRDSLRDTYRWLKLWFTRTEMLWRDNFVCSYCCCRRRRRQCFTSPEPISNLIISLDKTCAIHMRMLEWNKTVVVGYIKEKPCSSLWSSAQVSDAVHGPLVKVPINTAVVFWQITEHWWWFSDCSCTLYIYFLCEYLKINRYKACLRKRALSPHIDE